MRTTRNMNRIAKMIPKISIAFISQFFKLCPDGIDLLYPFKVISYSQILFQSSELLQESLPGKDIGRIHHFAIALMKLSMPYLASVMLFPVAHPV